MPRCPDLRRWRARHGLMAKDVARILGYSPSYISRCESGACRLSDNAWRVLEAHAAERAEMWGEP